MSKSAKKEEISLELQNIIEKLENILDEIKAVPPQDQPSASLIKRLVNTTEAFAPNTNKKASSFLKTLLVIVILLVVLCGIAFYFYNPLKTPLKNILDNTNVPKSRTVLPGPDISPDIFDGSEDLTIEKSPEIPFEQENLTEQEIPLTPEQVFIDGIKKSLLPYSNKLQEDLINSVVVDFEHNSLQIKLEASWYKLSQSQQNKLAQDIWQRSRNLNFTQVELKDLDGNILARNPVIGKEMIILKRKLNLPPDKNT